MVRLILLITVLVSSAEGFVKDASASGAEVGLSGELRARARHDDRDGRPPVNRVQDRYVFTAFVKFGAKQCYKVSARAGTGSEFDSFWNNTSIGDADRDGPFNLRNAWLSYGCIGQSGRIEIGDIKPVAFGQLGVKRNGWVDRGLRYSDSIRAYNIDWTATLGGIDPDQLDEPDLFSRHHSEFNYGQLQLNKAYSNDIGLFTDVSTYDDNLYLRSGTTLPLKRYTKVLDQIEFEGLLVESDLQGSIVRVQKKINGWKLRFGFVDRRDFQGKLGTEQLPEEGFFGSGENYHLIVEKKKAIGPLDFRIRLREGDAAFRAEAGIRYRFSFVNRAS